MTTDWVLCHNECYLKCLTVCTESVNTSYHTLSQSHVDLLHLNPMYNAVPWMSIWQVWPFHLFLLSLLHDPLGLILCGPAKKSPNSLTYFHFHFPCKLLGFIHNIDTWGKRSQPCQCMQHDLSPAVYPTRDRLKSQQHSLKIDKDLSVNYCRLYGKPTFIV